MRLENRYAPVALALLLALVACAPETTPTETTPGAWDPFEILGSQVAPGEKRRLALPVSESFAGATLPIPVTIAQGAAPGSSLCLTAGIHGDELNGVETVRRVLDQIAPSQLRGTLIGAPIVNLHGFRRGSRYLPDRRDLNRHFPGNPGGSAASRIADALFSQLIRRCDVLVDFHSASFHRTNLPQVRVDLRHPELLELAVGFGVGVVVHSVGLPGTLRRAATEAGIPAITYEAGAPMLLDEAEVKLAAQGVRRLLGELEMAQAPPFLRAEPSIFPRSPWVRAETGGILLAKVQLGDEVREGDLLGVVSDPISNEQIAIHSPHRGRVIGMALNQVVIPGFAAFHLGIDTGDEALVDVEESAVDDEPRPDLVELDELPE